MRASAEEGWRSEALTVPQQETVSPGDTLCCDRAGSSSYRVGTPKVSQIPAWHRIRATD